MEEIVAVHEDGEWVVSEYWVGSGALLHRLSARGAGRAMLCLFGVRRQAGYKVPWDKIELPGGKRLQLSCARHELERLSIEEKSARQRKRKDGKR